MPCITVHTQREVRIVCNQVEELVRLISVGEKERAAVQLERMREQTWSKVEVRSYVLMYLCDVHAP